MKERVGRGPRPTEARFALADNVKDLMAHYRDAGKVGISSRGMETKLGKGDNGKPILSYKSVDRIIDPYADTGPSLETIDLIAGFFDVPAWMLLRRNASLHPKPEAEAKAPKPAAVSKARS